nr:hypothetical protein Iba_chr05cCG10780 [Ipomoea batatas]
MSAEGETNEERKMSAEGELNEERKMEGKRLCCPAAIADMRESSPANTAPATIAANRLELAPDGGDNVGGVGVESPKSTGHGRASEILEHVELY